MAPSPPCIRVPSPAPGACESAASAAPARPAAPDDLLAPASASAPSPRPTTPTGNAALAPSGGASRPRSASGFSDHPRSMGLSPGLGIGRMLTSPSFAPEMHISASQGASSGSSARLTPRSHSPTDTRTRSPGFLRVVPSPPALTRSASVNYPSSRPDFSPSSDSRSSRLPGLDALLSTSGTKRQRSEPSLAPYVPHVGQPSTVQEAGRGPPLDLEGLGMVLGVHEREAHPYPRIQQPAAPRIGASDEGRFDSVMDLYASDEERQADTNQPQAYPSSLTVLNAAPTSASYPKPATGDSPSFPRVAGLTGLGISFDELHQRAVPPPLEAWGSSTESEACIPTLQSDLSPSRSPGLFTPAAGDVSCLPSTGTGLPEPGLTAPCASHGLSPVLGRVHISCASPQSSIESTTLPSPSEEPTPVYSLASLPDDSHISRSFEAVQATVPSSHGRPSVQSARGRGPASYRDLCKARSAALVHTTASAFQAHRSPSRPARGPASDAPIPPGAEDSPWGVFSLNPKKLGGWRPLFPPGIRPPVPGGRDGPDEPSPPKRARTARAASKKTPQSKDKAPTTRGAASTGKGTPETKTKTKAGGTSKPPLSMKNTNQMMA